MNGNQTVNVNAAECLKTNDHFGYSIVHNVCSGVSTTLQWGFFDWIGNILLIIGAAAFVGVLIALVFLFIGMIREL